MSFSDGVVLELSNSSKAGNTIHSIITITLILVILVIILISALVIEALLTPGHHVLDGGLEANERVPLSHVLVKAAKVLPTNISQIFSVMFPQLSLDCHSLSECPLYHQPNVCH